VDYEERNIRSDQEFIRQLVEDYNSRSTPTLVAGKRVIAGFDPAEYEKALANP
jgi:arsenate reductase-like glutaredoxin family protein